MKDPETLRDIVPEYQSANPVVRALFLKRPKTALELGELERTAPLDVLDLGCGDATFLRGARALHPQHRYAGWDVHPGIETLKLEGIALARVDFANAPLPARTFDRIFCLDVLEHFQNLDAPLAAIKTLLKPGGLLILSEPTESWLYRLGRLVVKGTLSAHEGPAAGPHFYDARGVDERVRGAGFVRQDLRRIPWRPFDLFHISKYSRPR